MNHKWKIILKDKFGFIEICTECKLEKSYFYSYKSIKDITIFITKNFKHIQKELSCDELIIKNILE